MLQDTHNSHQDTQIGTYIIPGNLECQRVEFKLVMLVFNCLHGLARQYLVDDCQLVTASGRRQLRSSDVNTCVIQRTHTRLGDRSFAVAGPRLWNSLPVGLRHLNLSIGQFRYFRGLKTHLFNWVGRLVTFIFYCAPYKCFYLLSYLLIERCHW